MKNASAQGICIAFVMAMLIAIPRATAIEPAEGLIAFSAERDGEIDIYTMLPDGSNVRRITSGSGNEFSPTWSPDGSQIAYVYFEDGRSDLYVMDANGRNAQIVSDDERTKFDVDWSPDGTQISFTSVDDSRQEFSIVTLESGETLTVPDLDIMVTVSWSPDGTQILYARTDTSGAYELFTYDLKNEEETQLTDDGLSRIFPEWSPDGTQILFSAQTNDREGLFGLYTMTADGSNQQMLLENGTAGIWSPDGSEIAFTVDEDDDDTKGDIYLMDADGSNVRQITTEGDIVGSFSWQPLLQDTPDDQQTDNTASADSSNGRIAFISDREGSLDLYTMNIDGTDVEQLTDSRAFEVAPAWSPDGTKIAYVTFDGDDSDLFVVDADGDNQERLTTNPAGEFTPTWSPDGTKIAFASERDGDMKIYIITLESGVIRRLIRGEGTQYDPAWSPDGTKIAFSSPDDGSRDIYVVNADGTDIEQLTNEREEEGFPRWSPDGTQIVFQAGIDSTVEIYVMDADGDNRRALTDNNDYDGAPEFSPDGTQILFTSNRDGVGNLYLMNADGSDSQAVTEGDDYSGQGDWQLVAGVVESAPGSSAEGLIVFTGDVDFTFELFTVRPDGSDLEQLTENDLLETSVAWSPDGTQVVFEGREDFDDDYDLYVIDADGDNLERLTDTPDENEEFPAWSPDGLQIAFESDRRGNSHIYVMNADGSDVEQLTRGSSYNQMASWSPDGAKILFSSDRDGTYNVYQMNPDGSDVEAITADVRINFYPRMSPDGTQIVYIRIAGEQYALYIMDADGSNRERLYSDDNLQVFPNWSPDGERIVFTSVNDEESHLYIIDRDGENLRLLLDDPEFSLYGSWTGGGASAPVSGETPEPTGTTAQDTGCRAIIKENLNLRESPETGRVILTVPVGTEVIVTNRTENNAWWKIIYNDSVGWVAKRFTESKGTCSDLPLEGEEVEIQPTAQPATATPTPTQDPEDICRLSSDLVISVREAPVTGDPVTLIPIGDEAEVIARLTDNSWYKVIYRDSEGWVRALRIDTVGDCDSVPVEDVALPTATPSSPTVGTCQISGNVILNVRVTPIDGEVIAVVNIGDDAEVIARLADSSWYKVLYEGEEGWVSALLVDTIGDCDSVRVEVTSLPTPVLPTATPASQDAAVCQISGNVVLNMRAAPVDGEVVVMIPVGLNVDVIARLADSSWYKVTYLNKEGWVSALLVDTIGDCDSAPIEDSASLPAATPSPTTSVVSPAGDLIVFSSAREGLFYLFVMNPDGTGLRRIVESESGALTPAWSPDGTRIAFSRNLFGNTDIYVANADGTNIKRVTRDPGIDTSPTWSPDGTKIAYTTVSGEFSSFIAVTGVDGRLSQRLSETDNDFDQYPSWSPDGTQIAFISGGRDEGDVYVMDADGRNLERLTYERRVLTPAWSPDGTLIAFALTRSSNLDIYTMDAEGNNIRRVTTHSSADFDPAWSPDGTEIVYTSSSVFGGTDIYVVDVESGARRQLTDDSRDDLYPDWNPSPNPDAEIVEPASMPTPAAQPTQVAATTETFTDATGLLTFDYLSGSTVGGSDEEIILTQGDNVIKVYTPANHAAVMDGRGSESFLEELKFFVTETGYTVIGPETEDTSFGKELAHVSVELSDENQKGIAFLVDVGGGNRAIVLWLTPQHKTLSAPMLQTLIKIMTSIKYTGDEVAVPVFIPTGTPESATILTSETVGEEGDTLTFEYFSGARITEAAAYVALSDDNEVIRVYLPSAYADILHGETFRTDWRELKSALTELGFRVIGSETDDTSFRKELAHVSFEDGNKRGTAYLIDLGDNYHTIVLWMVPENETLSGPMAQSHAKIMSSIEYEEGNGVSISTPTALPTAAPTADAAPAETLTRATSDAEGILTFDHLSGVIIDDSTEMISLIYNRDSIIIYKPVFYAERMRGQSFDSAADELKFFAEERDFDLAEEPTEDTSFGKALAQVSIEIPANQGKAFLVDVGNGHRVVIFWLTPEGQTLSTPMVQTLVKIMSTITYAEGATSAIPATTPATAAPTIAPTATPQPTQVAPAPEPLIVTAQNGMIVFASYSFDYDIYIAQPDGSELEALTSEFDNAYDPEWSPDGAQIVYASNAEGQFDIYVMDADGSNARQLTSSQLQESAPSWSPDGTQIVYEVSRDSNVDLYVMDANGGNARRLMENPASEFDPSWSPRGDQIVFAADEDDQSDLYLFNIADGSLVRLTDSAANERAADWSPDGMQIVFQSDQDGDDDIFIMNIDGSDERRLNQNFVEDQRATWSPDGKLILFQSKRDDAIAFHLYQMNPDGTDVRRLAIDAESELLADWQPVFEEEVIPATPTVAATVPPLPTAAVLPTATPTAGSGAQDDTVMDVILSDPELSTFATSIIAAGLLDELTSANGFQYTVFAPTNAAFDAMLADRGITKTQFLSDPTLLTAILSYHLLPGKMLSGDLSDGDMTTLSGSRISIKNVGSQIFVNDAPTITQDLEAANGVVYVIEEVLIPPALRD